MEGVSSFKCGCFNKPIGFDIYRSNSEDGEHEGIISGYAYNLAELGNVGTYEEDGIVFGVDVTSASYPVGFYPKEVATGCFVMLQKMFTRDARVIYLFDRQGTHDGDCT